MSTIEIENLDAATLKARRDELATKLTGETEKPELVARYLQARMDAKVRDEKLEEQGKTITALQQGMESLQEQKAKADELAESLQQSLTEAQNQTSEIVAKSQEQLSATNKNIQELQAQHIAEKTELEKQLQEATARISRLTEEATRNNVSINSAAKVLNDAIAQRVVEQAGS